MYFDYARFLGFDAKIKNSHIDRDEFLKNKEPTGTDILDPILYPEVHLRKQKMKESFISGELAAKNLVSRMNQGIRTIVTLRKFEKNIDKKVKAATALVWSNCYDLGLIYAFCGDKSKSWSSVCVAIKKLVKSAGLDYMLDSEIVFKVSTKMSPALMAKKQILQAGIKLICKEEVAQNNLRVKVGPNDHLRPFWSIFTKEFNSLEIGTKQFLLDNLDVLDKPKMNKIKSCLKSIYRKRFDHNGPISDKKRLDLLTKNLYSRAKVKKRKRDYEIEVEKRNQGNEMRKIRLIESLQKTPVPRRKAHSELLQTPPIIRKIHLCNAPVRATEINNRSIIDTPTNTDDPLFIGDIDDPLFIGELFSNFDLPIENSRNVPSTFLECQASIIDVPSSSNVRFLNKSTTFSEDASDFQFNFQLENVADAETTSVVSSINESFCLTDKEHDVATANTANKCKKSRITYSPDVEHINFQPNQPMAILSGAVSYTHLRAHET